MVARIAICMLICTVYQAVAEVQIITEPRQGEEYVIVSSGQQIPLRNFETSHKIPEKHPQHRNFRPEEDKITKKLHSGKVASKHSSEGIISIEEDKRTVLKKVQKGKIAESIEIDVPVSKIEDIKIKEIIRNEDINPKMKVLLEAMSESGKLNDRLGTTTQKPILTTTPPANKAYDYIPINFDTIDDINSGLLSSNVKLEPAGSEQKQHSRIQVKKGPNGQDYEYEYIYYYYDEDDDKKDDRNKTSSTTAAPVPNSHDGPQKVEADNQIGKENKHKSKYSAIDRSGATTVATPEKQNEVASGRGRQRGRAISPAPVEEEIVEDRLPSSTRFPPRGRNLGSGSSTTYVPEVSSETTRQRGRPQVDNVADESIGQSRSRMRAHIRRPSSELVDLDSFKTNSGDIPVQYKELPTRYSSESKTTTEVTEAMSTTEQSHSVREGHSFSGVIKYQEILDDSKLPADYKQTTTYEQDTTEYTTMTAMEKVALDLYAYLAGENLNNDVNPTVDEMSFEGTTVTDEEPYTTEVLSTTEEATTPTTTTTTTTTTSTTTPAPAPAPTKPARFRGRPGARARLSTSSSAATEPPQETSTRARGRFSKPGAARKPAAAAAELSTTSAAPVDKSLTQPKVFGRRGLFAGRARPSSSTPAPAQDDTNSTSETAVPKARLRPALRRASSTTPAPAEDGTAAADYAETTVSPPAAGRGRLGQRPASLRPGPRLNLLRPNTRLRPGAPGAPGAPAAPAEPAEPAEPAAAAPADTSAPDAPATDSGVETSSATPAPEQGRGALRGRTRLQVQPSPKPRSSPTPLPRRPNPLLKRKLPSTEATTEAAKKVEVETTEESTSGEKEEAETEAATETTPAPPLRGLDALFARRRAAGGIGARPARPARSTHHPK